MLELLLSKVQLYSSCAIPSILFFLLTKQDTEKHVSPDWLLVMIGFLEILVPLLNNARATISDAAVCATLAIIMTSSMFIYIRDRRQTETVRPFYTCLISSTNNNKKKQDDKDVSLSAIRSIAFQLLSKTAIRASIYIPLFAVLDGFLNTCQQPPETSTPVPYLSHLMSGSIPLGSTFYYIWFGITLMFHMASIPVIILVVQAIQLNIAAWMPKINSTLLLKLQNQLQHAMAQPPVFDEPWKSRSIYDLWSHRWHQLFRPGFQQVAYTPVRRLFGEKHKTLGRLFGSLAVFLCSGLMHDYIILVAIGFKNIKQPGVLGYQTLFFMLQAVAAVVSMMSPRLPTWLARTLTWAWILYTAPLFVEPYIRIGLQANIPGLPSIIKQGISPICPYGL